MRGGAGQGEIRTGEQVKNAGGTVFYTSGRNGLWFIVSEPQQKMCHAKPSGNNGCRFAEKGYYMTVQENEKSEGKQVYVEGLKRYQKRGIRVLIDGVDASDATWEKLFEVREDGSFYMGDYILEDIPREDPQGEGVNEEAEDNMKARRLKEIHFDIVYHQ